MDGWTDPFLHFLPLKRPFPSLHFLLNPTDRHPQGYAFCEYEDASLTDVVCEGLNGMELGDRKIVVQRANLGASKLAVMDSMGGGAAIPLSLATHFTSATADVPGTVIQLLNMVTAAELQDDESFGGIHPR